MKKLLLLLLIIAASFQSFGQDPDLLNTPWQLLNVHVDGQDNIPPPYNDFVVGIGLQFYEEAAEFIFETDVCNTLSGISVFNTNVSFDLTQLGQTLGDCGGFYDDAYEFTYFGFYWDNFSSPFTYEITDQGNNALQLIVTGANGDYAEYGNPALGISEELKSQVSLFPNPVSETLFITSEGEPIESISIYSISGQRVLSEIASTNQLDVSGLKAGLYFAEITTSEGKSIQKFVKK